MDINVEIRRLVNFGMDKMLIDKQDEIFVINRLLETLKLNEFEKTEASSENLDNLQVILDNILDFAYQTGVLEENTVTDRDLLQTKLMGCFVARPSDVIRKFNEDYRFSPKKATDNFYQLSVASNYIRTDRTDKNIVWKANTQYGELDITINLSKPEKDPRAVAAERNVVSSSYPKCLLCKENEGYAGRLNHPARQNLRLIPITLCNEQWYFQYSPYVYYHEHSIVFRDEHVPMKISEQTFRRLLAFVKIFPHYFIGSNADLPIVGGSILSHDHFQAGRYTFAMEVAPIQKKVELRGYEDVEAGIVKWPMSVIRLRSVDIERLSTASTQILEAWKSYSDESMEILSHTKDESHNTITPIARFKDNKYEIDLVLRNNRANEAHPLGIFHPHSELHHIKRENVGLIEAMGLAVLPPRLEEELELVRCCLLGEKDLCDYEELQKHTAWFNYLKGKYQDQPINGLDILKYEVGLKFEKVLADAGVFKQDPLGQKAFEDFINKV